MEIFVDIASFFGAWLLVAGPIFQSSIELRDQDIEVDRIRDVRKNMPPQPRVSIWWWLFPPAHLYLSHKVGDDYKKQYLNALDDDDVEALVDFRSKSIGWMMVAGGGLLLAVKETYELQSHFELPIWVFWTALVVMSYISISFTIISARRRQQIFTQHAPSKSK
jgi:hypothetical protein